METFYTIFNIILKSGQSFNFIYRIGIVIRYLIHFNLIFHERFKFLWNFETFVNLRNYIGFFTIEKYMS